MRTWVLVVALVACSKGDRGGHGSATGGSATVGSAAGSATAGSANVDSANAGSATAAVTPDAAAAFYPAKLGEREGIILADKRGGAVEGIADGTKVDVVAVKESESGRAKTAQSRSSTRVNRWCCCQRA